MGGYRLGQTGPVRSASFLLLAGVLGLSACGGRGAVGDPCTANKDCSGGLGCGADPFPGGYCTVDCSAQSCPSGVCTPIAGASLCLKACTSGSDCRDGYQCWMGACTLPCAGDGDCGTGAQCLDGACTPFSGAPLGAACAVSTDCSSRVCLNGACAEGCTRDLGCPDGQTCTLNASASTLEPTCVPRRATAAPGAACASDADCDRGSCQLGLCVELCVTNPDCPSGMTCNQLVAPLASGATPGYQGCLPTTGTIAVEADSFGSLPVPQTAQSMTIYARLQPFDFNNVVGVLALSDPAGQMVYTQPTSIDAFYALPVRYQPAESSSAMLVPNSPAVAMAPGAWPFTVGSEKLAAIAHTTLYFKLAPEPIASGTVDLNFYLTDLSGSCAPLTVASAPGQLAQVVTELKQIYGQVNVNIGNVTWHGANGAMNTVQIQAQDNQPMFPDLDNVLQAATANQPTTAGLDVVLLRSITSNSTAGQILGVAGGIPGSPVLGTPHSGAVVSIAAYCSSADLLAATIAHEVGHTLGLFHNVEQDGHTDPLTDTKADGNNNLMYWLEGDTSNHHLSLEQGQVLRNDPKVH